MLSNRTKDRIGKGVHTLLRNRLISDTIDNGIAHFASFCELAATSVQFAHAVAPKLAKQRK